MIRTLLLEAYFNFWGWMNFKTLGLDEFYNFGWMSLQLWFWICTFYIPWLDAFTPFGLDEFTTLVWICTFYIPWLDAFTPFGLDEFSHLVG